MRRAKRGNVDCVVWRASVDAFIEEGCIAASGLIFKWTAQAVYDRKIVEGFTDMSQFIVHQWNRVKISMDAADITFVLLRTLILWGLGGWLIFSPLAQTTIMFVSNLTVFFVIYTIFIYNFLFFLPERKRIIYGFSLFFDFLFTVLLVKATGGFESAFTNGFYLMTALYSFYFGAIAAAIIAGAATFLYCVSGGFDFSGLYWTDFSVRVAFIFLLAIPLGMLSQKLKRDKEKIEILNRDLEQYIKKQQKVSDSS